MIEKAVKHLGADRLLFATDGARDYGVGKILGANISFADKKAILSGVAFQQYLNRAGK